MKHQLPDLPFDKSALEPQISAETLEIHHGKHHRAYVTKLNELIVGTEFEHMGLEDIVMKSSGPVFNNAGQAWNHAFYWNSLSPKSHSVRGELFSAIQRDFGSLESFQSQFQKAAAGVFGSGWAWLVQADDPGKLEILTTPNAENPLRMGKTPLLTVDVWEHAYYIDYRNDRARYLDSIAHLLNWDFAEKNYLSTKTIAA